MGDVKRAPTFSGVVWEGVFASFDEVRAAGDGFRGQRWTKAMSEQSPPNLITSPVLPVLLAVYESATVPVRVLDYGGGAGVGYRQVMQSSPSLSVDYHVIEMENVCEVGAELFAGDDRIHFHTKIPETLDRVDVVHFGSSIQYVSDWKTLLRNIARLSPHYLLFSDLPAGENPGYVSAQTYYDSKIPVWFFNFAEFCATLDSIGFELRFRARAYTKYFGIEQPCPQDNFPPEYRLGYPTHALFKRK